MKLLIGVWIFFAESRKLSVRRIVSSTTRSLRFSAETPDPGPRKPASRQLLLVLESASCAGNFDKGIAGLLSSAMDCARSSMVKSRVAVLARAVQAVCTNWIRSLTACETACKVLIGSEHRRERLSASCDRPCELKQLSRSA